MVRAVSVNERASATPTPTQWDHQPARSPSRESPSRQYEREREHSRQGRGSSVGHRDRDSRETRDSRDPYTQQSRSHHRSGSDATGQVSSNGYPETSQSAPGRRHDYDVQSMETNLVSPRPSITRNPIPPPLVSIRSEFPTLNRSPVQQSLTCLVTIEVPDNKWRPDPDDLHTPPVPMIRDEDRYARPPSPAKSTPPRFYPYESPEVLEEMAESLRARVENWHGLDFSR
jgi:hypothetical protein